MLTVSMGDNRDVSSLPPDSLESTSSFTAAAKPEAQTLPSSTQPQLLDYSPRQERHCNPLALSPGFFPALFGTSRFGEFLLPPESRQNIKISSHCCHFLCRMLHVCKRGHCKAVCPSPHSGLLLPSDISKLLPCSFTVLLNNVLISVSCKTSVGYILRRKKQALCGGNFPNSSGHFHQPTVLTPNGDFDI